jgi:peptide/nickel transport system substrate-binding protein
VGPNVTPSFENSGARPGCACSATQAAEYGLTLGFRGNGRHIGFFAKCRQWIAGGGAAAEINESSVRTWSLPAARFAFDETSARVTTMLRRALALAVLACLAGCSAPRGRDTGVVRLVTVDPPSLNPLVSDNPAISDVAILIHGYLLRTDDRGRFLPDLAVRVPTVANGGIADGGRTIRYELARGVRWHDGVPFDARDVAFSFRAAMNPRNDVPDRSGFDDIASVVTPSAYEVIVRLKRPYSPAVATFFTTGANDSYAILPAHLLARYSEINDVPYDGAPIGLGPYRFVTWERGSRIVLEADPHFRRGAPHIGRVVFVISPDENTSLTLWQSHAIDFFPVRGFAGNRSVIDGARSVADAREYRSDHYQFNYVLFNTARGPLRDRSIREAIVRGVDRDRIQREVRGELSRPGDGDRLPGQFAYDPSIHEAAYDPVAAARLLDAAGWKLRGDVREKNGVPLALDVVGPAGSPGSERSGLLLQADLARLGIRTSIKDYQYNVLLASAAEGGVYASGRFDLSFYGWQPNEDADHSYLFRCDTRPPDGENYGRICDPAIDRDARIELEASDPAAQAAADRDMLRELDAQSDVLFLGFDRELLFTPRELRGVKSSVLGEHYWNLEDWSWR